MYAVCLHCVSFSFRVYFSLAAVNLFGVSVKLMEMNLIWSFFDGSPRVFNLVQGERERACRKLIYLICPCGSKVQITMTYTKMSTEKSTDHFSTASAIEWNSMCCVARFLFFTQQRLLWVRVTNYYLDYPRSREFYSNIHIFRCRYEEKRLGLCARKTVFIAFCVKLAQHNKFTLYRIKWKKNRTERHAFCSSFCPVHSIFTSKHE